MSWESLDAEIRDWRARQLWRDLRVVESRAAGALRLEGGDCISFASNDYLGLASSSWLQEQLAQAVSQHGAGAAASRLICGHHRAHARLEEKLADFKQTEAALSFISGHATATGVIPALVGQGDTVIVDRLAHACLLDGVRLSGATLRVFAHQDLDRLEFALSKARGRVLIVTESVFSMDGDLAPLKQIVELKNRYGAWLLLDEAHAVGVLGPQGRGLAAACGLADQVELHMGTLGKAFGLSGGYLASSRRVVDWLINRARSLVFSTAPVPALAEAAGRVVDFMLTEPAEELRSRLAEHMKLLGRLSQTAMASAILPWMVGDEGQAVALSQSLIRQGWWVPAVRYPTVGKGKARLRISLNAAHRACDLEGLVAAMHSLATNRPDLGPPD